VNKYYFLTGEFKKLPIKFITMRLNDNTNKTNRLQELSGSDYEIAEGQSDIRGWDVKDAQGNRIGEVDELIFDVQSLKVRYLVLDLEGNVLDLEPRDVLVPIGLAELHDKDDDVILPNVTEAQLKALPEYDEDNLNAGYEKSVSDIFGEVTLAGTALSSIENNDENDIYNRDHYNENNLFRNRRQPGEERKQLGEETKNIPIIEENLQVGKKKVETGGVRLRRRIVEKPVEENINLRQEEVKIEREPANRPATEADFNKFSEEKTTEIIERSEVPVVSKESRVVVEVSLNKEVKEREETVRDTVRKTEIDIENKDKNKTNRKTDL
jgi:uncharacterized protein (TIGR02271 family)